MEKDLKYYLNLNYAIEIKKIPEDLGGGWEACIPELGREAFRADGDTPEEALSKLEEIKSELFQMYLERGVSIPEPEEGEFSGRFLVRVPKSLHRRLSERAKREGVSLNLLVNDLLTEALTKREIMPHLARVTIDFGVMELRKAHALPVKTVTQSIKGLKKEEVLVV